MQKVLVTVPAHFDGERIRLDVAIDLKPDARLLVTILENEPSQGRLLREAMETSRDAFARVWDNDEDAVYERL